MQEIRIGRSQENEIIVDDPSVSRLHAIIFFNGNACFVRDNGSTNGTFINGRRIQNEAIQPTDILKVGNVVVPWRNSVGGGGFPQGNAGYNQPYNNMQQGAAQQQAPYFPPPARKKSNTGLILGLIGVGLVIIIGGILIAYSKSGSFGNTNYYDAKLSVEEQEKQNPLNFLDTDGTYRGTLFGKKMVLNGTITNSATVATYSDVNLEITYYSKTKSEIESEYKTLYEYFPPGQTKSFELKVDYPEGTETIGWEIISANSE